MQNAGSHFQRVFADEALLERLRFVATDPLSDPEVKAKCKALFGQWTVSYKNTPGMERMSALYKQLPQRKKPRPQQQSKVLRETEEEAHGDADERIQPLSPSTAGSSSSSRPSATLSASNISSPTRSSFLRGKRDKGNTKPFNLEKEKPQLLQTLASASVASTNLMNALKLINRENKRVSEDPEVLKRFETCKMLRRQILRYIQNVESEQWLGGLIHANEELVNALMTYEVLDKSVDQDSDSEDEWDNNGSASRRGSNTGRARAASESMAGLSLSEPSVPSRQSKAGLQIPMPTSQMHTNGHVNVEELEDFESDEEEDENDPFADRNAVHTPQAERPGMTW